MKSGAESGWDYSSRCFQRFPKKIEDFISRWFVGNESLDGEEELLKVKLPIINRKSLQSLNLANIEQPSPDWCQQQKNRWGPPTLSRSTWTASYARTPRSSQTSLPGFRCSHFFLQFSFSSLLIGWRTKQSQQNMKGSTKVCETPFMLSSILTICGMTSTLSQGTSNSKTRTNNICLRKSTTRQHTGGFYPSNLAPLYSDCIPASLDLVMVVVEIAKLNDTLGQPGGLPSSTIESRWIPGFFCFPNVATLAQAAVGLSKCVAAIGGNDCEYCQQQSTIYLLWTRLYLLKRQTPLLGKVWQKQLQTISSTTFSGRDWLYTY